MPNWCNTTYKIVGDDKELNALMDILNRMDNRKEPQISNGFGNLWLGELINELGYDWNKYRCRGEIYGFDYEDGIISIYQNTAWCEQEGVRDAIQQKYPSLKVYYLDEEPGCENFRTNDDSGEFFPDQYFLDSYEDPMYFENLDDAVKYVKELVGADIESSTASICEALEEYQEQQQSQGNDVFYCFHEFSVVED